MRPLRWALINYDLWEEEIWAHMGTEGRLCEDIRRRWPPVSQREKWNTSFSHGLKEESALQTASRIAEKRVSIALATPVCYSLPNCYSPSKLTQLVTYMHTCHYSWAKLLLDLYSDTFSYSFIYSFKNFLLVKFFVREKTLLLSVWLSLVSAFLPLKRLLLKHCIELLRFSIN